MRSSSHHRKHSTCAAETGHVSQYYCNKHSNTRHTEKYPGKTKGGNKRESFQILNKKMKKITKRRLECYSCSGLMFQNRTPAPKMVIPARASWPVGLALSEQASSFMSVGPTARATLNWTNPTHLWSRHGQVPRVGTPGRAEGDGGHRGVSYVRL